MVEVAGGFQFRTKPEMQEVAKRLFSKNSQSKLSAASLEVLAIISYKQPIIRESIDKIRGVDSSYLLRNLMDKKLVKMIGKSDLPGHPLLYGTTKEFLEFFGINDLSDLPTLKELEDMLPKNEISAQMSKIRSIVDSTKPLVWEDIPVPELPDFDPKSFIINNPLEPPPLPQQTVANTALPEPQAGVIETSV